MTWPRTLAIVGVALVAALVAYFVVSTVLSVADRNRDAIEVSCLVLSDTIVEAGASGAAATTKAGQAQAKLTGLYVGVIDRNMTAAEIIEAAGYRETIRKAGGALSLPDCEAIAADPQGYLNRQRGR